MVALGPLIALLAVLGLLNSAYVLYFMQAPLTQGAMEGAACAPDDPGKCQPLFKSPRASLIAGIPNAAFGAVFYLALLGSCALPVPLWWVWLLVAGAVAAVAISIYLFHSLVFVRHETCIPCFIGHGINLVLTVLLLRAALQGGDLTV